MLTEGCTDAAMVVCGEGDAAAADVLGETGMSDDVLDADADCVLEGLLPKEGDAEGVGEGEGTGSM